MRRLTVVAVLSVCASFLCAAQEARFVQDRFAIGFWVDPPADKNMAQRYREISEANFTVVLGGFGTVGKDKVRRQLKLCRKYDLGALVMPTGLEKVDLPDGPECWGYLLRDEPSAADFPSLRQQVDEFRQARPGKLVYINLLPTYASAKALGTATYEEHVARFMDEVRPDVLSMDHYPLFKPGADGRDGYCENLGVMRKYALQHGVPFWNFFNTMPYGPHTDPTEGQLRWQVYSSLAYGAKGVFYFCYFTPRGAEFPKGGAIMTADGRPTRHYDQAKRINLEIKSMGPTLMKAQSMGVCRVKPEDDPAQVLAGSALKTIARSPEDPANDYLIGLFELSDGRRAVLINNYRPDYTAWPTVEWACPVDQVTEVCRKTGQEVAVLDDSPDLAGLQLSLDAGEGRLFLVRP